MFVCYNIIMRHLAWAVLILLGSCIPTLAAPEYRAGQPASAVSSLLHGEISADYQFSSQKLNTERGDQSTSALKGWNVRALWTPLSWLSVGAEMTQFGEQEMRAAYISSYEARRIGGLVKFTLSPNTTPRMYLLAGYGKTYHQLEYDHSTVITNTWPGQEKKSIPYWMIGLGVEVDVWKSVFLGAEGNLFHHQTAQLPRFYQTDSKTETMLRVRAGVRF